jgi:hypothetical protein
MKRVMNKPAIFSANAVDSSPPCARSICCRTHGAITPIACYTPIGDRRERVQQVGRRY